MTSRVVPAYGDTIAASRRAKRLSRLDLPAFGGPRFANLLRELPRNMECGRNEIVRHVLVGKVDAGLDQCERFDQPGPPGVRTTAERSGELAHRLRALRLGLGEHQVGEPLDGGEIEPPIGERTERELASLRGPKAGQLAERGEHG